MEFPTAYSTNENPSWVGQSTTTAGNPGRIPACSWLVRQVCRRDQPLHLLLHVCRIQTGYWQYSTQVPSTWCVVYLKDARGEKSVWDISQCSDIGLQNLYFSISIVLLPQQPKPCRSLIGLWIGQIVSVKRRRSPEEKQPEDLDAWVNMETEVKT